MKEVFDEASKQLKIDQPVVVATVVRTKGSTPQKPGAKLLVRGDGTGVGTLGGGCVEGDIWFAAKELMNNGGPTEYRDYILNEDLAAQDGLVCGGTMYFLIDPVYKSANYLNFATEINQAYQGGPQVALATLTKSSNTEGSFTKGSKLFIRENGTTEGTLGSSKTDLSAINKAIRLMAHGNNEYVIEEDGTEFFVEAYTTPPQLVLCGGGHVSKAISPLAKSVGFHVFITDDREEFANTSRFPEADMVMIAKPEDALAKLPINHNTFIVIATRGHRYDSVALAAGAKTSARYVGLLGSKRKTVLIYEDLIRSGIPVDRVKSIRSPVGLDIHARTPGEIAISIISEALMFRLGGSGLPMKLENSLIDRLATKIKKDGIVTV